MFGPVGGPELILILALALLLFGPRKLPQIGKTLGKAMAEFRGATQEFRASLEREVELDELRKTRDDLREAQGEVRGAVEDFTRGTPRDGQSGSDSGMNAASAPATEPGEADPSDDPATTSDGGSARKP